MALQAGEISIKISTDTDEIKKLRSELDALKGATDKSKDSMKGMAGEFVKGQIVFEAIKKGLSLVVDFTKQSIAAFNESERAINKLRQVVSGNTESYIKYANEIQNTLNIEEELVLNTITLAKNMGVSEDKLKDVTNTALGLSKAFGIDLDTATKLAINAGQGNIDMLARYIPTLRSAKTEAEKQAIIQQAVANGFKIAGSEMQTFEGMMTQLSIQQGEIEEGFGAIVTTLAKRYLPEIVAATKATAEWINSTKTQTTLITAFAPALDAAKNILTPFTDGVKKLFEGFKAGKKDIDVFAIAMKSIGAALVISFTFIQANIKVFWEMIHVIKLAGEAATNFWVLLTGNKGEKEQARKNLSDIKEELVAIPMEFIQLGKTAVDTIVKMFTQVEKASEETGKVVAENLAGGAPSPELPPEQRVSGSSNVSQRKAEIKEIMLNDIKEIANGMNEIFNLANQAVQGFIQNRIALLDQQHNIELDMIQSRLDKELELIEFNGMTKDEFLQEELARKKAAGDIEGANEIEKQIKIIEATKQANKEREAADRRYAQKKYELEVAAFNTAKAIQIITATGTLAMGIVNAWTAAASAAAASSIAAPAVFAAVGGALTGILATVGAIQIGLIAATQPPPPPKFATGGIVPGARGAGDQTNARLTGGEMVLNDIQQRNLFALANGSGMGGMVANFYLDGEAVPIKQVFIKNRKNEVFRQ